MQTNTHNRADGLRKAYFMNRADDMRRSIADLDVRIRSLEYQAEQFAGEPLPARLASDLEGLRRKRKAMSADMSRALYNAGR